ncbi:MAG: hypothetical protein PUF57_05515 [Clostridiaceae bacterium]|nr:hypothetical protein [Clostridiaceae bacterium]
MRKLKRIICILLSVALLFLCACSESAEETEQEEVNTVKYNTPAASVKKTETVYVNLDKTGAKKSIKVSDWLHVPQGGVYVDDVTNLTSIINVKDDSKPEVSGQKLRWHLGTTDLYYQGDYNGNLPLEFDISYTLNDQPISAKDIAGKSGKAAITVKMKNVDASTVRVNGVNMTMYNPMLVVGGISLNETKFQNISVENGRLVGSGNNQYAVLAGFPGINESLGLSKIQSNGSSDYTFNDTFVISADVTNFEIGNFMFSAIPIASLDIGLNDISSTVDGLRSNLQKLQNVQKSLQQIDASNLLNTLSSNPDKLNNLSSLVEQASSLYDQNKALINVLNKYTTPENLTAIQVLVEYIRTADFDGLEDALNVINSIFGDDANQETINKGLELLRQMSSDLNDPEVQKAIENLPKTVNTLSELQKAVEENKDLINVLKSLSETNALSSIDSTLSSLKGSIATDSLSSLSGVDANELSAKMTAWLELGKAYTIFTKKTQTMTSSVMFVYKTDSVRVSSVNDDEENTEEISAENEAEETSGLKGLFNKIFKKNEG